MDSITQVAAAALLSGGGELESMSESNDFLKNRGGLIVSARRSLTGPTRLYTQKFKKKSKVIVVN